MHHNNPRFNPIPIGSSADHSANADEGTESADFATGSRPDRNSRVAAQTVSEAYRNFVWKCGVGAFAIGTGMTIYNLALGR